jgi:hypothetical protein
MNGQKWFAKRQAVSPLTDEDAAMASKSEGPFDTQGEAHAALIAMIEHEVAGWKRMDMDASRDERALERARQGWFDFTEGGVRWSVIEVTGRAEPTSINWQCDVHGITVTYATTEYAGCCELGKELGAYLSDERVCCALCEERIADARFAQGREFGRTSSNGAVCMPCVEVELKTIKLTKTQIALLTWAMNPTRENAIECRRATKGTRTKLESLGLARSVSTGPTYYVATIAGRKWAVTRLMALPLDAPADHALRLVNMAIAGGATPVVVERAIATALAEAIERRDERAIGYHRATLDALAILKRAIVATGGGWE